MDNRSEGNREKKKRTPLPIIIAVIVLVVILVLIMQLVNRYTPSKENMDLNEYYVLTSEEDTAIILNNEISSEKAVTKNGIVYLKYDTVHDWINERFYWDANENLLLYTTESDVVTVETGSTEYKVTKEKNSENYVIFYTDTDQAYIAAEFVKKYSNMQYNAYTNPNRIVITTNFENRETLETKKATQLRYQGGIKSPILAELTKGQSVYLLTEEENWYKAATEDGYIGYVKKNKTTGNITSREMTSDYQAPEFSHILKDTKINLGWHQVTSTEANSSVTSVLNNAKEINVISPTWFYLNDNEGNLMSLASAEYVEYCHQNGVEVWALVSNLENPDVDSTEVLTHTSKRTNMVNQLIASAIQNNFDGINVDFEALSSDVGDGYIQFIRELSLKCENNGIILSVDNYVPSEYTAFYNRREQANYADYLIIMAYDEHFGGSEEEGSTASLPFVEKGVKDNFTEGVPAEQLILGIPFYTRVWCETPKGDAGDDVDAAQEDYLPYTVTSKAVGMREAANMIQLNGAEMIWLEEEGQYYAEYQNEGNTYKIWLEDATSIEKKLAVMKDNQLAGAAFWKLGFEDASLWNTIVKYMD